MVTQGQAEKKAKKQKKGLIAYAITNYENPALAKKRKKSKKRVRFANCEC